MRLNLTTPTNSRISVASVGHPAPTLAGFVVCPLTSNFPGSPVMSPLTIYQLAYEQAKLAASQQWWGAAPYGSRN